MVRMNTTNMNQVIDAASYAAQQSDRWLFIAALIVGGVALVYIARYFVKKHDQLMADHRQAGDAYQSSLKEIIDQQNKTQAELAVCITKNTEAFNHSAGLFQQCAEELRLWRDQKKKRK